MRNTIGYDWFSLHIHTLTGSEKGRLMKTVLVTGCAGLFGSQFSQYLAEKEIRVIGIDDLSGGYKDFVPINRHFEFIKMDLSNDKNKLLEELFDKYKFDAVYHFAAYAAEGLSPFIRRYNYTNNVIASVNVINACINFNAKLIFTSSMAVYGDQIPPFREDMILKPIDPYGNAKATIEYDIAMAHNQFGLRYTIVRPHNVVGINQNIWDRYRNVLGIFIRRTIDEQPMQIYGDGEQTRAFSDIQYYLEPLEQLGTAFDSEVFNLGSDEYISINELALLVEKCSLNFKLRPRIIHAEARHEAKAAYCDHTKAKRLLRFQDRTSLENVTNQMFEWALNQPKREVKNLDYETTRGLYAYWK